MKDLRFLDAKDTFLERAYLALKKQFPSRDAFDAYFNAIRDDEQKNLFLKTASFYLFLVKCGDWVVNVPNSDKVIDYFTNTYKYVAIFSLIESLSEEQFVDFYQFLTRLKSRVKFPIADRRPLMSITKNTSKSSARLDVVYLSSRRSVRRGNVSFYRDLR